MDKNFITPTTADITLTSATGEKKTITKFFVGGWDEAFDWWDANMFNESAEQPGWFFEKFQLVDKEEVFEGK